MRVLCTSQLRLVSLNISYTSKLLILSNSIGLDSFIFKGFEDNWQSLQPSTFSVKSANFTCKCRGQGSVVWKNGQDIWVQSFSASEFTTVPCTLWVGTLELDEKTRWIWKVSVDFILLMEHLYQDQTSFSFHFSFWRKGPT